MKKILLFAVLALAPASMFAYSSSSGEVGIMEILSVVMGILSIILFFKIWGATNDLDAIKRKVTEEKPSPQLKYYVKKAVFGKAEATKYLKEAIAKDLEDELMYCKSNKAIHKAIEKLHEEYKEVIDDAGILFPALFEDKEFYKEKNLYKK